jgi:hypothetical protein
MPPINGAIVRFCSNGDSYFFHYGIPVVPLRNTFGLCSGNISVEADVLRPRPVEIGDEQISRARGEAP